MRGVWYRTKWSKTNFEFIIVIWNLTAVTGQSMFTDKLGHVYSSNLLTSISIYIFCWNISPLRLQHRYTTMTTTPAHARTITRQRNASSPWRNVWPEKIWCKDKWCQTAIKSVFIQCHVRTFSANERRRYICTVFSHLLKPFACDLYQQL